MINPNERFLQPMGGESAKEYAEDIAAANGMPGSEDPIVAEGVDTHLLIEDSPDELVRRAGDGTANDTETLH